VTVGIVWNVRVFFGAGVVVMGIVGDTTLRPRGPGDPELPPVPKAVPPSSKESSKAVCKDSDPLCTIPTKMSLVPLVRGKTQAVKAIDGELQAGKMNCFSWSEADGGRVVAIGNEGEFQ
jgi:hypothetical protein